MTQEEKELQDKHSCLKWLAIVITVIAVDILIHSFNNF